MKRALWLLLLLPLVVLAQPGILPLWEQRLGGSGDQAAADIQLCSDGGFIVVGSTRPSDTSPLDIYAIRLGSNGDTIWTHTYPGTNTGTSVVQALDGNFVISGFADSPYLLKVDSTGDTLWTRTFHFQGYQGATGAYSVRQTSDGGLIVVGDRDMGSPTWIDVLVIKTDLNGDTLWTRTYDFGQGNVDFGYDIVETQDQGYLVVGYSETSWPIFDAHPAALRITGTGDTLWSRVLPVSGRFMSAVQSWDSTFLAAGKLYDQQSDSLKGYLVKFAPDGDQLWQRSYSSNLVPQVFNDVQNAPDGNFVLTGSNDAGAEQPRCYLVKVSGTGDTLWTRQYGGSEIAGGSAVCIGQDGYVVAGASQPAVWEYADVYVVCSGVELSIGPEFIPRPSSLIVSNYPNPFNSSTEIRFDLPQAGQVNLRVFDITGREVAMLKNETMSAGSHAVDFDASFLPSGVYIYCLTTGNKSLARKMVLLR